jgi:hypothetical protein
MADGSIVRACVQGVIDACAEHGRDVASRLRTLRIQQLGLVDDLAEDHDLRCIASCLVAEIERRLPEFEPARSPAQAYLEGVTGPG